MDAETHRPSVVYRRKGWDYGVIGIDDQTGATASVDAEPAAALA